MVIRKLILDDLEFLLEVRNHDSTRINLENNSIFSLDECILWFNALAHPWYIIEINNKKVGYIRTKLNIIGVDIHMDERNKGYATRAYSMYLNDIDLAFLWVFEDNHSAKSIYDTLNFKNTGNYQIIRNRKYIEMEWRKF